VSAQPADQARGSERISLAAFNGLAEAEASRLLTGCCAARRWVSQVAAGRPFESVDAVLQRSDAAVAGLTLADLEQALSGHLRIGERPGGDSGGSWREQSGVDRDDRALMRALADGNRDYEQRFGHIYLVCASGRSGAELLALLRGRLGNDPAAEWRVVRSELEKINRIRLARLLEEKAADRARRRANRGAQ
jgi:2-oxo-4-hydroxy-4-carboxy-5-ureidoimidazoline decarboxylase